MSDLFTGLSNFTKSVTSTLNSYEMRKIGDKVQGYVMNFTEAEAKVREATNEDPWGPTGPQMVELAGMTFQYDVFPEIMGMLWKRMFQENKIAWRRVYKSLILLNYLLKNGSERVISTARDHMFEMRALESYKCLDERGKDEGVNVRHRARLVIELLQDDEQLRVERRKAKTEGREKYQGFSKDEMLYKGGAKVSSFESWNAKPSENNFRDNSPSSNGNGHGVGGRSGGPSSREITAFDFAEGRNQSGSPELGIPDRGQEAFDEDDEFGEFSEARGQSSAAKTARADGAQIPSIAPPAAKSKFNQPSAQKAAPIDDLFSLAHTSATTAAAPPVDLFQSDDNGVASQNSLFASPQAPAAATTNSMTTLDDIFGVQPLTNATTPSAAAKPSPVGDLFTNDTPLFANNSAFNSGPSLFDTAPHHQPPSANNGNSFDPFGAFATASNTPSSLMAGGGGQMSSSKTLDGISSSTFVHQPHSFHHQQTQQPASSASVNNLNSMCLLDGLDFGHAAAAAPMAAFTAAPSTNFVGASQTTQNTSEASSKLPKTWEDLKGKVNIDFDNLSLRPSPAKPTPTLNELQGKKGGTNNLLL